MSVYQINTVYIFENVGDW